VQKHNAALLIPTLLGIVESIALPQWVIMNFHTKQLHCSSQVKYQVR